MTIPAGVATPGIYKTEKGVLIEVVDIVPLEVIARERHLDNWNRKGDPTPVSSYYDPWPRRHSEDLVPYRSVVSTPKEQQLHGWLPLDYLLVEVIDATET